MKLHLNLSRNILRNYEILARNCQRSISSAGNIGVWGRHADYDRKNKYVFYVFMLFLFLSYRKHLLINIGGVMCDIAVYCMHYDCKMINSLLSMRDKVCLLQGNNAIKMGVYHMQQTVFCQICQLISKSNF